MRLFKRRSAQADDPLFVAVQEAMADARDYAKSHGGDIELVGVDEDGTVRIKFRGACSYCPLSSVTVKLVVEKRLMELVPHVRRVVSA
ncbi:MAG TPA: NifU family protein [Fimbriimonadaceae bacterium]|nr:NifU family protein [Fimbriimonadaceae bacterium]